LSAICQIPASLSTLVERSVHLRVAEADDLAFLDDPAEHRPGRDRRIGCPVWPDQARWILAFDASCGTCREISQVVDVAAEGKLEVLSLSRPDVREWREQAFGADAPWMPTLIRVDAAVAAWTGVGMSVQLVRSLGLRSSIRVLRALGELKHQTSAAHPTGVGRRRALRIGAAAVVAAGMMIAGQVPSFGATAEGWVAKNPGKLPHDYDEFSTYSLTYRKRSSARSRRRRDRSCGWRSSSAIAVRIPA
jgi:hypothetical protein